MGVLSEPARIFVGLDLGQIADIRSGVWVSVYFRGNRFYDVGRTVPALFFGSGRRVDFDEGSCL